MAGEARPRRMSLTSETLARGTLTGSVFPKAANACDFPLVSNFFVDKAPTDADLAGFFKKLLTFDRFRSKVVPLGKGKSPGLGWASIADFDPMEHVTRKEMGSAEEFHKALSAANVEPIDPTRPLWDISIFTLKPGVKWEDIPGGPPKPPCITVRVSHAIGDGLALVNALNSLATGADGEPIQLLDFSKRPAKKSVGFLTGLLRALWYVWVAICTFFKCVTIAFGPRDAPTCVMDKSWPYKFSGRRQVCISDRVPLSDLKAVKDASGCTVNDVVVALMAGAHQKYLAHFKDKHADKAFRMRAILPYAFPNRAAGKLANFWTFISLRMPTGAMPITKRLAAAKRACDYLKMSPEPWLTLQLNVVSASVGGSDLQRQTAYDYISRQTMVFTNVPGPTSEVHMMGQPIKDLVFSCANLINQVSVVSYNGQVRLTMVVDPEVTRDCYLMEKFFLEELDELKRELGVGGGTQPSAPNNVQ